MQGEYYVYILMSKSGVLYVGITRNLVKRMWEHKQKFVAGFTEKYQVFKLVYFEVFKDSLGAIAREKQIKKWRREKKLDLIKINNPHLRDLYSEII